MTAPSWWSEVRARRGDLRKTYRRDGKISRERVISADMADRSSVSAPYEQLADTGDKLEWLRTMDEWTPADVRAPAPRPLRGAALRPCAVACIALRAPQVVEWLKRRQFDKYAEQFRNHKITGRHLMRLEEKHLIEMTEGGWLGGAMPVGDRIRLLQDIQRLAIKYQNALRFETKWEAHAPRFTDGARAVAPPPPRSIARALHPTSRRRPARFPQAVAPVHAAVRGGRPLPPDGELVCRATLHAGAVPARISAR